MAAVCASAKEFSSSYDAYKTKYSAAQLDDLSRRVTTTMRADTRTAKLLQRLEHAATRGVDLSSLKYPNSCVRTCRPPTSAWSAPWATPGSCSPPSARNADLSAAS
jgi:hypothetical protein